MFYVHVLALLFFMKFSYKICSTWKISWVSSAAAYFISYVLFRRMLGCSFIFSHTYGSGRQLRETKSHIFTFFLHIFAFTYIRCWPMLVSFSFDSETSRLLFCILSRFLTKFCWGGAESHIRTSWLFDLRFFRNFIAIFNSISLQYKQYFIARFKSIPGCS